MQQTIWIHEKMISILNHLYKPIVILFCLHMCLLGGTALWGRSQESTQQWLQQTHLLCVQQLETADALCTKLHSQVHNHFTNFKSQLFMMGIWKSNLCQPYSPNWE